MRCGFWAAAALLLCSACVQQDARLSGLPSPILNTTAPATRSAVPPSSASLPAVPTPAAPAPVEPARPSFGFGSPESQGIDSRRLIELTEWVRSTKAPIFSLLISRNNKVVYELYTSGLSREQSHYLMSVTKSVVSALIGIAIDKHVLSGPEQSLADALPVALFSSDAERDRFRPVTIHHLLGMSALDALVPPHSHTAVAVARNAQFWQAKNRVRFALQQALLPTPGVSFQYNDISSMLATGIIQYGSGKSALRFAEENLFGVLDFRNYEWMHQDQAGIDNGGYGLRLRPIDMQKFGMLYLQNGWWEGHQVLSPAWVDLSFTPWIRNRPELKAPNYGWSWWYESFHPGWPAHLATGWKGQRIGVFPSQGLVVTMTGLFENDDDGAAYSRIVRNYVVPALSQAVLPDAPSSNSQLVALIEQVRGTHPVPPKIEKRMVPTQEAKENHREFQP